MKSTSGPLRFYLLPCWLLFHLDCQTLKNRCAFVQIDLEVFAEDVLDSIQVLLQRTITAHDFATGLAAVARSHNAAHHLRQRNRLPSSCTSRRVRGVRTGTPKLFLARFGVRTGPPKLFLARFGATPQENRAMNDSSKPTQLNMGVPVWPYSG